MKIVNCKICITQLAQQIFSDEIEEVNPARENTIHNSIFKL